MLKTLKLSNWAQHSDRTIEFRPGLTGIIGPNGKGKSNLIRAIQRLLCGDLDRNLQDMVQWEKNEAQIECELRVGEVDIYLEQTIGDTTSFAAEIGDSKFSRLSDIREHLGELFGAPTDVVSSVAFANQGKIGEVLFGGDAARTEFFQTLFGIKAAKRGRAVILEELNRLPSTDHRQDLKTERERLQELKQTKAKLEVEISGLKDEANPDRISQLEDQVAEYRSNKERKEELEEELPEQKDRIERLESTVEAARQQKTAAKTALDQVPSPKAGFKEVVQRYEKQADLRAELRNLEQKIPEEEKRLQSIELGRSPERVEEDIEALDTQIQQADRKAWRIEQMLTGYNEEDGRCPLCLEDTLTELPDWATRQHLEQLRADQKSLKNARRDYVQELSEIRSLQEQRARCEDSLKKMRQRLEEFPELIDEDYYQNAKSVLEFIEQQETALSNAKNVLEVKQPALEESRNRKEKIEEILSDLDLWDEVRYNEITGELKSLKEASQRLENVRGQLERCGKELQSQQERVEELEHAVEKEASREEYRGFLEQSRELLHRDNLPARIMAKAVSSINGWLRESLEDFELDFSAWLDEETFAPVFLNSRSPSPQDHGALSGGEKTALAVCFQTALWKALLPRCDLLVLDEPTFFLDDDHVESLVDLLESVRIWAEETQSQLLVPTHDKRLQASMDQIIEL